MSTPVQGQRSRSSALVGTFNFDNVSSPSNTSVDQPIYWNDARNPVESNPVESRGVDLCPPPSPSNNIPFLNSIHQEMLYLPGSTDMHAEMNECARIAEHLPTASANGFAVPQDQVHGPANFVPLTIRGSSSSSSSYAQNLNSPVGFMGRGSEDSPLIECPMWFRPSSVSDTLPVASSSRDSMRDNEASPGVRFDGHQVPHKRKALEGHVGQSSDAGGSSYLRNVECSALPNTQASYNACMNSGFSPVSDQRDRGHGLSLAGASASNIPDQSALSGPNSSQRSCRIRITSVDQGASNPSVLYSIANPIIQSPTTSSQEQLTVPTIDHSLDTRSAFPGVYGSNHDHRAVLHIPAILQSGHSVRWSRGIISRHGGSPNATLSQTGDVASNDEASSSRGRRSARENPIFLPPSEMGIFVPNPLSGRIPAGDETLPTNGASSSRSGSSSSINHSSNAHWDPHYNRPTHYPHWWSEYVCRSLMSSMDPEPDGQTSNSPRNLRPPAVLSQEMVLPSRASFPDHALPSRSSVCRLSASAEGRRRLASEVQNVLDIMCHPEGLRCESVFFGMEDMHDRHRDMRLDVDNMSYEELLALGERIGNVSTGLSEVTILARLNRRQHTATTGSNDEIEPCCICQEEYSAGDDLGALECGHDFHRDCIKQWLILKNLCPVCKTTGLTP